MNFSFLNFWKYPILKIFWIVGILIGTGLGINFLQGVYYQNNRIEHMNTREQANISNERAYFAGGCFWCMEGIFESQDGVFEAISGYTEWTKEDATYERVSAGITQHREAVEVVYNPQIISFEKLVELYFTQIDPVQSDWQFADIWFRYTTAVYYSSDAQKWVIEKIIQQIDISKKFDKPVAVKVVPFTTFFPAEEYHQDYYKKSAFRYSLYKKGSWREDYIKNTWWKELEKLTQADLKAKLTPIQYEVTQENWTERPFINEYHDNKAPGIYVDIVDGTPLYSSLDKYDSWTGWPSFTRPIDPEAVTFLEDKKLFSTRIEVRSRKANSHLGHVFDDGPVDAGGKRYCMNSAALRFIPLEELDSAGYGQYKQLFEWKN
jgi:peptide methionine sulfoxide reductase msrA/msrB